MLRATRPASFFIFEAGISTVGWFAVLALRMRVSMSAIGSVMTPIYQEAFVMPGMKPRCAFSRKQMRHMPNLR